MSLSFSVYNCSPDPSYATINASLLRRAGGGQALLRNTVVLRRASPEKLPIRLGRDCLFRVSYGDFYSTSLPISRPVGQGIWLALRLSSVIFHPAPCRVLSAVAKDARFSGRKNKSR